MNASQKDATIEGLTRAVGASEAGRRAGWARAYSAEATKDDLSREINILRAERDIMRNAASFMNGFIRKYLELHSSPAAASALARWANRDVMRVLDIEVIKAGMEAAEKLLAEDEGIRQRRATTAESRKERKRDHKRTERNLRAYERQYLCKRFGIPNEAALLNYLEEYRTSDHCGNCEEGGRMCAAHRAIETHARKHLRISGRDFLDRLKRGVYDGVDTPAISQLRAVAKTLESP